MTLASEESLIASFRGVPFFWRNSSLTTGQKTITHEYPKSNRRFVEQNGLFNDVFTIEAEIKNDNYKINRDRLKKALNLEGSGILQLPMQDRMLVKVEGTYTIREDYRNLGEAVFSITFAKTDTNILPIAIVNPAKINTLAKNTTEEMGATFISNFKSVANKISNFDAAKAKISEFTTKINKKVSEIKTFSEKINKFTELIEELEDVVGKYLKDIELLEAQIQAIFDEVRLLGETAKDRLILFIALFDYGSEDEPIAQNSTTNKERYINNGLINNLILISSISYAYVEAIDIEYISTDAIDETKNILNEQVNRVFSKGDEIVNGVFDSLKTLQSEANNFLEKKKINTAKIIETNTQETTLTALTYQYYGSLDNYENLIDLNNFIDLQFIRGNIKVLTNE
jgi:prophage DNA circulation protein